MRRFMLAVMALVVLVPASLACGRVGFVGSVSLATPFVPTVTVAAPVSYAIQAPVSIAPVSVAPMAYTPPVALAAPAPVAYESPAPMAFAAPVLAPAPVVAAPSYGVSTALVAAPVAPIYSSRLFVRPRVAVVGGVRAIAPVRVAHLGYNRVGFGVLAPRAIIAPRVGVVVPRARVFVR